MDYRDLRMDRRNPRTLAGLIGLQVSWWLRDDGWRICHDSEADLDESLDIYCALAVAAAHYGNLALDLEDFTRPTPIRLLCR